MANLYNWSTTAADNDDAGTPINWAENQLPSTVNNSSRELMKQVADWRNLLSGAKISSGTNTTTLTTGLSLSAYAQGTLFAFEQGVTNSGPVTINVDSIGAKDIKKFKTVALVAGDLVAGGLYIIAYEATAGNFQLISPTAQIPATQTGAETLTNKTLVSPILNTSVSGTAFLDEDNLASNSASKLASQQSIKAYADALKSATETLSNKSLNLNANTVTGTLAEFNTAVSNANLASLAGSETLTQKTLTSAVLDTSVSGSAFLNENNLASNSATKLASQASIKAYVDAKPATIGALAIGNNLSDLSNVSTARSNLGVAIGTNVLAPDGNGSSLTGINTDPQLGFKNVSSWADSAVETVTLNPVASAIGKADVSVWEEIPDSNKTNNIWDIVTNELGWNLVNSAYSQTLTPAATSGASIAFTLGSGNWASTDIGKRIVNASASENGEARIISVSNAVATAVITTTFSNTDAIAAGDWKLFSGEFVGGEFSLSNATQSGMALNDHDSFSQDYRGDYSDIVQLSATHYVVIYSEGNTAAKARVITYISGNLAFGASFKFDDTSPYPITSVCATATSSTQVLVSYRRANLMRAVLLTASGTSLSKGGIITTHSANNGLVYEPAQVLAMSSTKVIFLYSYTGYVRALCITINGTSLSIGSVLQVEGTSGANPGLSKISSTKAVAIYNQNNTHSSAIVLTLNGSTLTKGSVHNWGVNLWTDYPHIVALTATTHLLIFRDSTNSYRHSAIVLTVSGTTVSSGSKIQLSTRTGDSFDLSRLTDTTAIIAEDNGLYPNGEGLMGTLLTVDGTSISAGTSVTLDNRWAGSLMSCTVSPTEVMTKTTVENGGTIHINVITNEVPLYVTNQFVTAISGSDSVDSTFYSDWNSNVVTQSLNGQTALYAFSTNSTPSAQEITGGTFGIIKSGQSAVRKIASSLNSVHGGTNTVWFINTNVTYGSETWSAATTNEAKAAIQQASAVSNNQMSGTEFAGISDANLPSFGTQLSLAITLKSTSTSASPAIDKVVFNYDGNVINRDETDQYIIEMPATNKVRISAPSSGNSRNARIYISK